MVVRFKQSSEKQDFRSRYDVYLNTAKRLAKYGKQSMIEEIIDHQKKFEEITGEPFVSRLIVIYGKVGMFQHARKLFDEMPSLNCPQTVYSFNALLSACIDCSEFDEFNHIVKELPPKLGITLDVVSYNTIMKGLCKMGALDSAAMVVDQMVEKGVSPSLVTFNTLLNAFYTKERFADGEATWKKMMMDDSVSPDVRSYNARILGLGMENRMEEAEELVNEMGRNGIETDVHSFIAMIKGCVKLDNLEGAKRWYEEIQKQEIAMNSAVFYTLVPFLCEKGDLQYAFEVCRGFLSGKVAVDGNVVQSVVDGLIKGQRDGEAEELVELGCANKYKLFVRREI
ncbi:Pentatricopeptide repeat-containing protein At3g13160, mitochondrial [Linum grandiflorum]